MPFNTLVLSCLCSRETSFCERGTGAELCIKPNSNEIVLFFVIDDQSNKQSTIREDFGIEGGLCDLAIFYADKVKNEKIICLAELKGRHVDEAVDQIINTFKKLKKMYDEKGIVVIWKAYILFKGRSPRNLKKLQMNLQETIGKNSCLIGRHSDISDFLRGKIKTKF
ncbi:MAG: hypothetical protein PHD17_00740 [Methanothrix soehngenii]|jgi:hypothetical protein|nr:hypothetical protein [Methanothrix soehngenii]MDY0130694.1 hypothetical protein [Methanosarcina vacuolata]